jgi:hypothetical protein
MDSIKMTRALVLTSMVLPLLVKQDMDAFGLMVIMVLLDQVLIAMV